MTELQVLGAPLRVQRVPLADADATPCAVQVPGEVRLWLAQEIDLHARCHELMEVEQAPFWAFCWASGQALARFVTSEPARVRGKHVVDFGAGCGIAGIAAALAGAASVTAVDIDPAALAACTRNAALNGVALETADSLPEGCDVILAADVLYDEQNLSLLAMLRARAAQVLLSDPGRQSSPDLPEAPLATYTLTTLPDVDPPMRQASVYELRGDDG